MTAELEEYVLEYMRSRRVLILATSDSGSDVWACPVYYALVGNSMLFVSRPDSLHAIHIGVGATVAFAVTDTDQRPPASAHGIQGRGLARPATIREYPLFARYYARMFPKYGENLVSLQTFRASLKNARESRPYILFPTFIKLTDKRFSVDPQVLSFGNRQL